MGKRINVRSLKLINRIIGLILIFMAIVGILMGAFDMHVF